MEFFYGDDMKTKELLEQDLIMMIRIRHTRTEAEVLAGRITDLIYDAAKEVAEDIISDHLKHLDHSWGRDTNV